MPHTIPARLWASVLALLFLAGCAGSAPVAEQPAPAGQPTADTPPVVREAAPPPAALPTGIDSDAVAGPYDNGRMWTFDFPPTDYFSETYGFDADEAWFEKARLGALRLPNCTASFVSPQGLAMTNNHCTREQIDQIAGPGESLVDDGFFARDLADERPVPGWFADQLIAIEDVTDEVYAALDAAQTDAERVAARESVFADIQLRLQEAAGSDAPYEIEIVDLYNGGKYSAYTFRRFTDLRMVMTAEQELGYFGGDSDNFTYPRYNLDVSFFRVYVDGQPYRPDAYFRWSVDGASAGDPVFIVGNPGSTNRLETVAQLVYRRDVMERTLLDFYTELLDVLRAAHEANPSPQLHTFILQLSNTVKVYEGRLGGLRDPELLGRRADAERAFREAIEADPELRAEYGDLIDEMAEVVREKTAIGNDMEALIALPNSALTSATLRRGIHAYLYLSRQASGAPEAEVEQARQALLGVADQSAAQDEQLLANRLARFARVYGEQSTIAQAGLQNRTPEAAARAIRSASPLSSAQSAAEALEDGNLSMDDPAVQLAAAFVDRLRDYQSAAAGLNAREAELAARLGRARFAVYGTEMPPDATFSLRINDGRVEGYPYNGTIAPPLTTFYGLYDRYYSHGEGEGEGAEWQLPDRWLPIPADLDLSTPMNIVTSTDVIGGNSGSPLLSTDLEIVGLVFDGNMESLPGSFIYVGDVNRSVSVDARGILEALDAVYDMDRVVVELVDGSLQPTEADADAARSTDR